MVEYPCLKCGMIFNKMSNYKRHLNKKFNCLQDKNNFNVCTNVHKNAEIESSKKNDIEPIKNDIEINTELNDLNELSGVGCSCGFCKKMFYSSSTLNRHLKLYCRVKKQQDEEKENIFKMLLEKDKIKDKQINLLIEQNQMLLKKIDDLTKNIPKQTVKNAKKSVLPIKSIRSIKSNNTNTNNNTSNTNLNSNNSINSNNINSNNTQNIVMVNFGKEDLSIIDKKIYIDRVVKKPITGVKIPEEILKLIHFNPDYPQHSNIYISDINREKCMVFEDGEWKLSPVDKIPEIIDKVVEYSNEIEFELRTKHPNNVYLNQRLDVVNKYVGMNDENFIDELKEEPDTNSALIKRCENFQKMTYDTFKTTLYNEGKKIKKISGLQK
jgi:hypothetical protein